MIDALLEYTVKSKASDLHLTAGIPPVIRKDGKLLNIGDERNSVAQLEAYAKEVLTEEQFEKVDTEGEIDLSYSLEGIGRFRLNVYKQRGAFAFAFRVVGLKIPTLEELGHPPIIGEFTKKTRGLVLITGPTGSGKSTTLAGMINKINQEKSCHIITLEDPIEYLHRHGKSIINQREIGTDSMSYSNALRAALREDPDVILIGEMRDLESISIALTAAETGHLVFSTLHTIGAAKTIDRIIDSFPPHQQQQIRVQLSTVLLGVVSQQLIERKDKEGRVAVLEIMVMNAAIRNLIRESKVFQINSVIQTSARQGMNTMDNHLVQLYKQGSINYDDCITYCADIDNVMRLLGGI